jgi:hypothetical protein
MSNLHTQNNNFDHQQPCVRKIISHNKPVIKISLNFDLAMRCESSLRPLTSSASSLPKPGRHQKRLADWARVVGSGSTTPASISSVSAASTSRSTALLRAPASPTAASIERRKLARSRVSLTLGSPINSSTTCAAKCCSACNTCRAANDCFVSLLHRRESTLSRVRLPKTDLHATNESMCCRNAKSYSPLFTIQ